MRRLARPLLYVGTFAVVLLLGRVHAQFIGHYVFHTSDRLPWTVAYAGVLCVAAYGVGLPDLARGYRNALATAAGAAGAGALGISLVQLVAGSLLLPRFVVAVSAIALVPWYVGCWAMATAGRWRDEQRDRVVAVVSDAEAEVLQADLGLAPERAALLAATLTADEAMPLGPKSRPLVEAVVRSAASVVVLDRDAQSRETIVAQAATLHESGVRIRTLSLFYDEWLGKLPLNELERISLMFDIGEIHRMRYGRIKRMADVALGMVGLLILLPVTIVVVLGNVIGNRGNLVYRQPRVGKNGSVFQILKFRTMRSEGHGAEWTEAGDRRITPFGRWLRRTHLDELPQVLNILRGDLSIVGPRPEQPHYVAELREKIPFYDLRSRVRPGLTGWAQVKYVYGASEADAMEKLQYEFFYLRHQSLVLDLRIVGRTVRSVIGHRGR